MQSGSSQWESCGQCTLAIAKNRAVQRFGIAKTHQLIKLAVGDNTSAPRKIIVARYNNKNSRWRQTPNNITEIRRAEEYK